MTAHKATGTQLFISKDPLPENPTREDFERLAWKEIGNIVSTNFDDAVTYTPIKSPTKIIRRGNYYHQTRTVRKIATKIGTYTLVYLHRRMNKKKRARFGRITQFRVSAPSCI